MRSWLNNSSVCDWMIIQSIPSSMQTQSALQVWWYRRSKARRQQLSEDPATCHLFYSIPIFSESEGVVRISLQNLVKTQGYTISWTSHVVLVPREALDTCDRFRGLRTHWFVWTFREKHRRLRPSFTFSSISSRQTLGSQQIQIRT